MKKEQDNAIKPFWSWNDKLEKDQLCRQIDAMKQNGIEGFFMHARGGLITEYMGDEWFEMIGACLDRADELGMQAWAYDENGWPSGFASGAVPAHGETFQQKWLVCREWTGEENAARIIGCYRREQEGFVLTDTPDSDCIVISYDVNPYYIDTLDPQVIRCFIENTHEKYYERFGERFGSSLKGFFTDEPQYGNNGCIPWSQVLPEKFSAACGYSLAERLPLLFYNLPGSEKLRSDFYNVLSRTFRESFIKQMYDWCTEHHCKLTGHMMSENNLSVQMNCTGGVMPCYEYFHEPGIDWLRRQISSPVVPKQLGSVAAQLGRKTMTETFAMCGWDVSLNELKWIAQWQYVNGVTSLCPHLEGYSLRGLRKRDYPASLFTQLPWFEEAYREFADYFTALGALLDSGTDCAPLLVIHMLQSAYAVYNPADRSAIDRADASFERTANALADLHIPHHYGDETIMEHHAAVEGDSLLVGKCRYRAVLLPELINLTENTVSLLTAFAENGGRIYATGALPRLCAGESSPALEALCRRVIPVSDIAALRGAIADLIPASVESDGAENPSVHLCIKDMPDGTRLYYLVNHAAQTQSVRLVLDGGFAGEGLDPVCGGRTPLVSETREGKTCLSLQLAEYGSVLISARAGAPAQPPVSVSRQVLALGSSFEIARCDANALTLDFCSARIDGGEWQPETAVIKLQKQLLDLRRPCQVELKFRFFVEQAFDFSSLFLCVETPGQFAFEINGQAVQFCDSGFYLDEAIRRCAIGSYVVVGENTVILRTNFYQREEVYRVLYTPGIHETELNKLTLDCELESIYLTGDFAVKMQGDYRLGERRCIHAGRKFSLVPPVKTVDISDLTPQGFWFFAGRITLAQNVTVQKKSGVRYIAALRALHAPAAKLYVNGEYAGLFGFAPFELDVTDFLRDGENRVEIMLCSGNRNLLGPHHKPFGESYSVGPSTFSDQPGWADDPSLPPWTDDYSFVLFGAEPPIPSETAIGKKGSTKPGV